MQHTHAMEAVCSSDNTEIQLHAWDTEEGLVVSAPEPTAAVTTDENPTLSKEDEWVNIMAKHWAEASGKHIDQASKEFRQLSTFNSYLNNLYSSNSMDPGVWDRTMKNVTPDGGVRMRVVYSGNPEKKVLPGMYFMMQYTGYVEPNFTQPVDATYYRGRREVFKYEEGEPFIVGLFFALGRMHLGETSHVRITSDYAFGANGVPPRIPPDAILHYLIEIRDEEISNHKASARFARQPEDCKDALGFEVCFKAASEFGEKGVAAFRKGRYDFARDQFEEGIQASVVCLTLTSNPSPAVEPLVCEVQTLCAALRRNAAVAYAKLFDWKACRRKCKDILEYQAQEPKAIFYIAKSYRNLGKEGKALEWTRKGIKLYPSRPEFSELYEELRVAENKDLENERLMCMRMFASAGKLITKENKWDLVSSEVRKHVAEEIAKMRKNINIVETAVKYAYFSDKVNLAYLEEEACKAGLAVSVTNGVRRISVKLHRK